MLQSVARLLKARGVLAFRMNTGTANFDGRVVKFGCPGMADILAFPRFGQNAIDEDGCEVKRRGTPHPLWIETKSSSGHQRRNQEIFELLVKAEGHAYLLIRSAAEVNDYLAQL